MYHWVRFGGTVRPASSLQPPARRRKAATPPAAAAAHPQHGQPLRHTQLALGDAGLKRLRRRRRGVATLSCKVRMLQPIGPRCSWMHCTDGLPLSCLPAPLTAFHGGSTLLQNQRHSRPARRGNTMVPLRTCRCGQLGRRAALRSSKQQAGQAARQRSPAGARRRWADGAGMGQGGAHLDPQLRVVGAINAQVVSGLHQILQSEPPLIARKALLQAGGQRRARRAQRLGDGRHGGGEARERGE